MKEAAGFSAAGCVFIVFIALVITIPVGVWGARVFFAEEIGKGNAEIQLESAPSRISNYNYFFNLCTSVQNAESAIDAQTALLEKTTNERDKSRINQNIAAQTTVRMNGINQYNNDAKKQYTQARFLASNLPYQLDTRPYTVGGPKTQCAS